MKSLIVAGVGLLLGATVVFALDGPGRAVVASNKVQIGDGAIMTNDNSGSPSKGFIVPYSGTVRVSWEVRSRDGNQVAVIAEVIHLSSCSKTATSMTWVAQSCDLRVSGGSPLTVFGNRNASAAVDVRKVNISYDLIDSTGKTIAYQLPPT